MLKQIVMMNGHTATGKSTVARRIETKIPNTLVLHTAVIRKELGLDQKTNQKEHYKFELDDSEFIRVSTIIYNEIIQRMRNESKNYETIVLDGTYNFLWQRMPVYEFATELDVHLVIVNCVCFDETKIVSRLDERKKNSIDPFAEASEYETYLSTKALSEDIFHDLGPNNSRPHIIVYDSDKMFVCTITEDCCKKCRDLSEVLYDIDS